MKLWRVVSFQGAGSAEIYPRGNTAPSSGRHTNTFRKDQFDIEIRCIIASHAEDIFLFSCARSWVYNLNLGHLGFMGERIQSLDLFRRIRIHALVTTQCPNQDPTRTSSTKEQKREKFAVETKRQTKSSLNRVSRTPARSSRIARAAK